MYSEYGLMIRQELLNKGKSLRWLAREIGCSTPHLSEMLKGTRSVDKWIDKINDALKGE